MKQILLSSAFIIAVLLLPDLVLAQTIQADGTLAAGDGFVPCEGAECNACHFVVMANTIIRWMMGIIAVLFAVVAVMAGWGLVTSAGNPGAVADAKKKFINTFIGFVIVLGAWLLIDTIMLGLTGEQSGSWANVECTQQTPTVAVSNPITILGEVAGWTQNADGTYQAECDANGIDSAGNLNYDCTSQATECGQATGGAQSNTDGSAVVCNPSPGEPAPEVTNACSPISPITDPAALEIENGVRQVWTGTDPRLRPCAEQFAAATGGSINSVYRPQAYQSHLYEVSTKACQLSRSGETCQYAAQIEAERAGHDLPLCGAVARSGSRHTSGTAVDIGSINHANLVDLARQSCLVWRNYPNDPAHYDLLPSCSCS